MDAVAAALERFEVYCRYRDFKSFHHHQPVAFKQWLSLQRSEATGKSLSKATLYATLSQRFSIGEPGLAPCAGANELIYAAYPEISSRVCISPTAPCSRDTRRASSDHVKLPLHLLP